MIIRIFSSFAVFVLVFMLMCFTLPKANAAGYHSKEVLKATEEEFNQFARAIRLDHPLAPINFIENNGEFYYYTVPRRLKRLFDDGHLFKIKKIRFKDDYVGIEFESDLGAKPSIRVFAEGDNTQEFFDVVIPGVLQDFFDFGSPWAPHRVVGNTQSKEAHLAGSNHLPIPELRLGFSTLEDAQLEGYVPCTLCFEVVQRVPLEGYFSVRMEAVEAARLRKIAFPPVENEDLQNKIQDLGETIISGFPLPTMGYDYEFKVLHSEIPWAESYPTGFVFVSDRLMDMIEDSAELEFILAHEVAHVELYIKEISQDPQSDSSPGAEANTIQEYYKVLRAQEHEFDLTSLIYLAHKYNDPRVLNAAKTALRKLQYFGGTVPKKESGMFETHPTILKRITYLEDNFFIPWAKRPVFCDLDDDEVILTAEILGITQDKNFPRLVVRISATDLMNKEGRVRGSGSAIGINGMEYKLKKSDFPKVVGRNQSRIFLYDTVFTRFKDPEEVRQGLQHITDLDLGNIGGAKNWEPCLK